MMASWSLKLQISREEEEEEGTEEEEEEGGGEEGGSDLTLGPPSPLTRPRSNIITAVFFIVTLSIVKLAHWWPSLSLLTL